jgi:hypothetical protein
MISFLTVHADPEIETVKKMILHLCKTEELQIPADEMDPKFIKIQNVYRDAMVPILAKKFNLTWEQYCSLPYPE